MKSQPTKLGFLSANERGPCGALVTAVFWDLAVRICEILMLLSERQALLLMTIEGQMLHGSN